MLTTYTEIYLFLAAENNEEAKFLFSKKEIILPDLLLYEGWLQLAEIKEDEIVFRLNKIIEWKEKSLQNQNYEQAANERCNEREVIRKIALLNRIDNYKLAARRDFGSERCYLLLQEMDKYTLHTGFEMN